MDIKDIAKQLWDDGKVKLPIEPIPFAFSMDKETKQTLYIVAGTITVGFITAAIINSSK